MRLLREVGLCQSQDAFAKALGFAKRTLGNSERGTHPPSLALRRALDLALENASDAQRDRFLAAIAAHNGADLVVHGADAPVPVNPQRAPTPASPHEVFASRSSTRTKILLDTLRVSTNTALHYFPSAESIDRLKDFLSSSSRVYVTKGPPGCGKTRLMYHFAEKLAATVNFQLHSVDSWDIRHVNVAAEILRYSSIAAGDDSLLTLEQATAGSRQQLLVVLDGVKSQDHFNDIGGQLDAILRQVTVETLRFLVVIRTPPDIDMSAYPVLAASVHEPRGQKPGTSYYISTWNASDAEEAWNRSRGADDPAFSDLPSSIQRLARLPLYMQLVKSAGYGASPGNVNEFRLVDHCIRSILHTSGQDVEQAMETLAYFAQREAPDLVPKQLTAYSDHQRPTEDLPPNAESHILPLTRVSSGGFQTFEHDVIREYFLANRIASLIVQRGRSVATVGTFNELAARATVSASARGVFNFVVYCLDRSAPDLSTIVALSPTISVGTTLPLMIKLVADGTTGFATDEVLRMCANRCFQDSGLELSRSLLATTSIVHALGDDYAPWIIGVLRRFGSAIWTDIMLSIEQTLDARAAKRLLASADLNDADEAAFFARYFFLFFSDDQNLAGSLEVLLAHADWRVRAALGDGLRDEHLPHNVVAPLIMNRLVRDHDYKVRAAAAEAIGRAPKTVAEHHLMSLLVDQNWHVRRAVLQGLLSEGSNFASGSPLAEITIHRLVSEESWARYPTNVGVLMERLLLLHNAARGEDESEPRQRAIFGLLRELRTGWIQLPDRTRKTLVTAGESSPSWLVRREVHAFKEHSKGTTRDTSTLGAPFARERFRRLRDRRSVQVALDLHDLDHAVAVAKTVAEAGIDFIEVGDPLIKKVGLHAVEHIKRNVPQVTVVAEMMSADWGRDQVILAAEAGADVVLLIGPASTASVSAAVDAGRRLGVPIVLDVPAVQISQQWIREMERVGVDGFVITTNIDLGVRGRQPLAKARLIRSWTRLPIAVSGGFSVTDHSIILSADWDILIIGRSITEAVQPTSEANHLSKLVHRHKGVK